MARVLRAIGSSALLWAVPLLVATRLTCPNAAAAVSERQFDTGAGQYSDPVAVVQVTLNGTLVQRGRFQDRGQKVADPVTPFLAGDDWISGVAIYLLNRTNELIVQANIELIFPEATIGLPYQKTCTIKLGKIPDVAAFYSDGNPLPPVPDARPIGFLPRHRIVVPLGRFADQISSCLGSKLPLGAVTKIRMGQGYYYFESGMRWSAGGFWDPDPHRPGKWISKGDKFPGDPDRYWPGKPGWDGEP